MANLVFHPETQQQAETIVAAPPHALLITGPTGSGKTATAYLLAAELLGITTDKVEAQAYVRIIKPEGTKAISIESVRELEHFLSLKVPSAAKGTQRVVIIEQSQQLGMEAQNALLKTLEEPPLQTVLILTAIQPSDLLPTIRSRMQVLQLKRPLKSKLQERFTSEGHSEAAIKQALTVSGGLPGLTHALLTDEEHPLKQATDQARTLLQQTMYERLAAMDTLAKDKILTQNTLFILQHMAHLSLLTATGRSAERWQTVLKASYDAAEALSKSAQPKLVLTNLMVQLG